MNYIFLIHRAPIVLIQGLTSSYWLRGLRATSQVKSIIISCGLRAYIRGANSPYFWPHSGLPEIVK